MKGKIVLMPFPFTDLTSTKLRPALVLYEGQKDVVVAFISSRIDKLKYKILQHTNKVYVGIENS